jgi:IMP dehydrogenase
MLGSGLAGTDETPGIEMMRDGRRVKMLRGMAGLGANLNRRIKDRSIEDGDVFEITPEGVDAYVPCRGPVENIVSGFVGGMRSGISYCGARCIEDMHGKARFVRMTNNGLVESRAHDVAKL